MTQMVDLSKLCPPEALRPHFQNGLLVADYPSSIDTNELIRLVPKVAGNFSCRLLTKFHLKGVKNWIGNMFNPIPIEILFPNKIDKWYMNIKKSSDKIKRDIFKKPSSN